LREILYSVSRKSIRDLNFPQKIWTKPNRESKARIVLFREKPIGSGYARIAASGTG